MNQFSATPQRLADLFAIADRTTTAELFNVASAIATGSTTTSIVTEAPAFLRAMFPNLSDDDLNRVAILASWAMYCQHTKTTSALVQKWKTAKILGADECNAADIALATAAEFTDHVIKRFTTSEEEVNHTAKFKK
jgi:hypothetical protein